MWHAYLRRFCKVALGTKIPHSNWDMYSVGNKARRPVTVPYLFEDQVTSKMIHVKFKKASHST